MTSDRVGLFVPGRKRAGGAGGGGGPRGAHSLNTHGASQVIRKLIISDEMAAPLSSFSTTDLLAECALVPINYDTPALRAHAV